MNPKSHTYDVLHLFNSVGSLRNICRLNQEIVVM